MKKKENREIKKARYEKPVLTKFNKLKDVMAQGHTGPETPLGCTRF